MYILPSLGDDLTYYIIDNYKVFTYACMLCLIVISPQSEREIGVIGDAWGGVTMQSIHLTI